MGIVLLAWLYMAGLHLPNDGLWFQGDAPRHAANGIFWKEFLLSGSLHPQDYALRYYARYPDISPTHYPPVFYLVEAAVFGVLYPSPYLAKGIVLIYALGAALYLRAWLRRWVSANAGWEAGLLLLLSGFVCWSHAIMLNVPAAATSFAALYHARRWIESPPGSAANRQFYLAAALSLLSTLTYFPSVIVSLVILAWLLVSRRWSLLFSWRTVCVAVVIALLLLPWLYVLLKWAPIHMGFMKDSVQIARVASRWVFYLKSLRQLVGPLLLTVSGLGLVLGVAGRRWRHESLFLLTFLCVAYVALSVLGEREGRYALLLCMPIICYCSIAFQSFSDWLGRRLIDGNRTYRTALLATVAAVLFGAQGWMASRTPVPRVQGIRDVVEFMEQVAPDEPVFYDGEFDGVFTFYLQAGDPEYRRRVVLGAKTLYASAIMPTWNYRSFVSSVEDVVDALESQAGCRWIVVEMGEVPDQNPAARLLRKAVQGDRFELVRSFPITGPRPFRINVYRLKGNVQSIQVVDLPFPILGEGVRFKVRPIQR